MFGPLTSREAARIARLPRINRARGGRLYTAEGERWIDCWADGGRALLGHRPRGVSSRIKSVIDKGVFAPYPSVWAHRLEKALLRLFPGCRGVRLFENLECAMAACGIESLPGDPLDMEPTVNRIAGALWGRPLLPNHPRADFLLPILPLPGIMNIQSVLFCGDEAGTGAAEPPRLFSPVILAALTRACLALDEEESERRKSADTAYDGGDSADIWERRGPYMLFRGSPDDYDEVFEAYFARSILIAPSSRRPSVYPTGLSAGEQRLLRMGCTR